MLWLTWSFVYDGMTVGVAATPINSGVVHEDVHI